MTPDSLTYLRCEYLVDPLGIDEPRPRLSWVQQSSRRGAAQTAYRVVVASSADRLAAGEADLWDSGRVASDQSTHVEYDGAPLTSRAACHWQVTLWDERGEPLTSPPAMWTMGLMESSDWQADWVTHDPQIVARDPGAQPPTATQPGTPALFRKSFDAPDGVVRATLYVTARGLVEPRLNGAVVTPDCFVPEWTDYHKRLHYRTYDVTRHVRAGENALAATLGDGWWSGYIGWQETRGQYGTLENSLLMQLEVELADGRTIVVPTDGSWSCTTGPIIASDFMMGETYDARRERTGWDQPGYDATDWLPVVEVPPATVRTPRFGFSNNAPADSGEPLPLVAQRSEPVRVVERLAPVSVTTVTPGVHVYDFGQNFSGWVELSAAGPAGTRLVLRHGERLNPDGTLYTENLRRADATDAYTLRGGGAETLRPHFTFHGFQYLEITGIDEPLPLADVRGCVVMSATPPAGEFECSHPLVNRLWKNALWGQKGNFLTVPTDCPQRDERLGWMGDAQVFMRSATYNMDVAAFFTKWMNDVTDSQDADGLFPDVAPRIDEGDNFVGLDGLGGGAGWADAGVIVPWTLWRVYGDRRIVQRHWDAMVRWLDWLERVNPESIRENHLNNNYGDWLCIPADTTFRTHSEMKTLLATAYWADDAAKMAAMARALGRADEADRFDAMFTKVRAAFGKRWLEDEGRLAVETQTAYLLALAFNLLPEADRAAAASRLVELIAAEDWHLSTGFIGIKHLNPELTLAGHADVAGRLLTNEDYPSWLYPVVHGATTIWERWNGWTADDGFFNPQMNSFNHYSLGSVAEWLYRHVAGIELDDASAGFKQFVVKPYPTDNLQHAGATYRSVHGEIESRWRIEDAQFKLRVRVPANTTARVFCPCPSDGAVTEGGQPAAEAEGVQLVGFADGYAELAVRPGLYEFAAPFGQYA
ncbi:Bacterial alpha-L-rhamnosidase [Posidoniimonas corsicana]|uniref:alpha-L-rhamnosidase n=1 Tax=Posidoniimonas corsicana TaxID=1938618 RepID=A0A5C5UXN4_9BACT|nr:alpha-L-rhamnosidase [Posidoniimonas corsicana]TWT30390.1 Bacterial alpha-L-rhamnosidase [Posidoniimonas corsicana]